MSNNKPIKLSKVIQFADSNEIRRIDKGYYKLPSEWNPQGNIVLVPIEEVPVYEKEGIRFEQSPSLEEYATFVEVVPKTYACIERKKYAPAFMENKQKLIAVALQKLGIHEYYIDSDFKANAEMGRGDKKKGEVNEEISTPKGKASVSGERTKTQNSGFNAEVYYVKKEYNRFEGRMPSMQEWEEARNWAIAKEVYPDISDIIEMRKPGTNNLLYKSVELHIGGSIDYRISLAKSLKVLAEAGPLGKIGGGFLRNFDFEAKLEGQYKTVLFYNFDPKVNSKEYQDFVNKQLQKKDS